MRRLLLSLSSMFIVTFSAVAQDGLKERLEKHVYTLASDSLLGRSAGSDDSGRASQYIIRNFEEIGLKPFVGDTTYKQKFGIGNSVRVYMNIIGYIEGSDPVLKNEYVIIGAHYDHLGYKKIGKDTVIYHGADDNASGTATMIEIARNMKSAGRTLKRTVVFAAFDAEEIGLYGSRHMSSLLKPENVPFMASIDMVGWLRADDMLKVAGVAMLEDGRRLMENVRRPEGLNVKFEKFDKMMMGGSDHDSFARRGIPAFYITTGLKSPYHQPEDTADKIDYDGMVLVTEYLSDVTATLAAEQKLVSSGRISPKHSSRKVEFALTASLGSSVHNYRKGALTGKSAFAWNAGFFAQFRIGKLFALRPEVLYQQRSARYPAENIELGGNYVNFLTRSVTVPVNFLVKFPENSPVQFYINAGGYYSYNLSGRKGNEKIDFSGEALRHEWGWTAGCGFQMGPVGLAFSSFNGLSRVMNEGPKMKNGTSYFTLYYRF